MTARLLLLVVCLAAACSETAAEPETACAPNQFRACETDACHGVQQCSADGRGFSACSCTILDGGYPPGDAAADADSAAEAGDAEAEAGDAGDAEAGDAGDPKPKPAMRRRMPTPVTDPRTVMCSRRTNSSCPKGAGARPFGLPSI